MLAVLPALLCGKHLDFYAALGDSEKIDLHYSQAGPGREGRIDEEPFHSSKAVWRAAQEARESIRDFELALRKLFAQAYPGIDANTSAVLLGRFITGLHSEITRQILLVGTPDKLDSTVQHDIRIERALTIEEQHVHTLQVADEGKDSLRETLEKVMTRLEAPGVAFTQPEAIHNTDNSLLPLSRKRPFPT